MTHTTTLLADHHGVAKPKALGIEYYIDAVVDVTSYTSGGEVLTASEFGLSSISAVVVTGQVEATQNIVAECSAAGAYADTDTVHLLAIASGAEVSSATDLDGIRLRVFGLI